MLIDGDEGYDDEDLYELSRQKGFELVCPIARYETTSGERLDLILFYQSELGQAVYSWRSKSIEPLFEQVKDVFGIDPLSSERVRQGENVRPPIRATLPADGVLQQCDWKAP